MCERRSKNPSPNFKDIKILRHLFADTVYNGRNLREVTGRLRSSHAPSGLLAFNSSRADGLLSKLSPGAIATADWQRISKPQ
jgi:hypothetical protein